MLLLRVIDGRGSVTQHVASSFPCSIGCSADSSLQVEAPGVWERHASIDLSASGKFVLRAEPSALVLMHGQPIGERQLAAGDELFLGSARLLVSLSPPQQKSLASAEVVLWFLVLSTVVAEVILIVLGR